MGRGVKDGKWAGEREVMVICCMDWLDEDEN